MHRNDVLRMVQRRAKTAELGASIGCHTFRATGIAAYLKNGGRLELAQKMAGHANAKTTVCTTGATTIFRSMRSSGFAFN